MAYVYGHLRLDKHEIFYIGIGHNKDKKYERAYLKAKRNNFWLNIINKTKHKVIILVDNLTWEEACKKEIELISLYGRRDLGLGTLVNLTNGGDGTDGRIVGDKTKLKISQTLKEKNYKHVAKLKLENVIDICDKLVLGFTSFDLKKIYPVLTNSMLNQIRRKKTWKEITSKYDFPKLKKIISEETKTKISAKLIGKCFNKVKKIKCLNDNKIFKSVKEASIFYKIGKQSIYNCINKRCKTVRINRKNTYIFIEI